MARGGPRRVMIAPRSMAEDDPLHGTPYRTLRPLGEGGMGEVYEVQHVALGKLMVAKILRQSLASDQGLADRVRVEAQALAALSHENIVEVVHFDWTRDGRPYFIMEKLNGRTVGDELRARSWLPVPEAIGIVREALGGLEAAHQAGLVHRDIKLDNLFLHTRGDRRVVKVLDFGIAKVLAGARRGPAPPQLPTADGAIVGTPRYVSPEQVLGKPIDGRADLYSIALVLYTLLAGRGPFDGVRGVELYDAHVRLEPEPPSRYASQTIPAELDAVILRALRKNPDDRFQSAAELGEALDRITRALASPVGYLATTPIHALAPDHAAVAGPPPTRREGQPAAASAPSRVRTQDTERDQALAEISDERSVFREPTELFEHDRGAGELGVPTRTAVPAHASQGAAPAIASPIRETSKLAREESLLEREPWIGYVAIAAAAASAAGIALAFVGTASVLGLVGIMAAGLAAAGAVAFLLGRRDSGP
jgi:eukaryotic-like serine/threonine-protein kinase